MEMYFENSSKQKKKLITTDYIEDIYDVMEDFFEEHKRRPHLLHMEYVENNLKITFESGCESFLISDMQEAQIQESKYMLNE